AGDGNVHLSIFQPDPDVRHAVVLSILQSGVQFGGGVSAEHGIGKAKRDDFIELEDTGKLDVMRRIKSALDPAGLFSPGNIL
ncbi:MAG: FAD-binding oxidoreductase, partial [Actinobacteria bacterium]|nr:FAD-binding oxidoreductase [Actinomycetota bacterium]